MKRLLVRFLREESGENLIEYGLLSAFVAAVGIAVIVSDPLKISKALRSIFNDVVKALSMPTKA